MALTGLSRFMMKKLGISKTTKQTTNVPRLTQQTCCQLILTAAVEMK
jgi:hypothetical protein